MAFRFSNPFKQPQEGRQRLDWKDWRSLRDRFQQCWNIPTILLLAVLVASIWVFRSYGLEHPIENAPFMEEWVLEVWVVLDAVLFFLLLRAGGWLRFPALLLFSFWGTVHLTSAKIYGDLLHYGQIASAMETLAARRQAISSLSASFRSLSLLDCSYVLGLWLGRLPGPVGLVGLFLPVCHSHLLLRWWFLL